MNSYTLHITLYDLFFFGMIFIGLNFALLLAFVKSISRSANRLLALALLTMILWMMRILAIDIRLQTYLPGWDRFPMQFLLALGPLMYFYVLKITRPEYKFNRKDFLHFIPVLLEQVIPLNPVVQLLIFISVLTYLYQSHMLIEIFYGRLKVVMMDRSRLEFRWLRRLLAATALLWLLWIAYAAVDYFGYRNQLGIHVYYPFYIFFTVIIIWTAAAAFLRPQAGVMVKPSPSFKQSPPAELKERGAWLRRAMEARLYYQDPELSVSSLARELNMPPHELSRIINVALKKNFSDFINEYRIREVARKMQNQVYDRMTLLGIAFESGFNSKTTFNRTFRQMTGKSPAEYKSSQKKERPFSNLERYSGNRPVVLYHETAFKWSPEKLNRNYMFKNYFKTAIISMTRSKLYTLINVFGLSIGLACVMLISLYIKDELSFDRFNENGKRIYRLVIDGHNPDGSEIHQSFTGGVYGQILKEQIPRIQATCRVNGGGESLVRKGNDLISEPVLYADNSIFKIFTLPLVQGDPETALKDPRSVVITENIAKKYFGNVNPVGKVFEISQNGKFQPFLVSAVAKNPPLNSTIRFSVLLSIEPSMPKNYSTNDWISSYLTTFLLVQPGASQQTVEKQIAQVFDRNAGHSSEYLGFKMRFPKAGFGFHLEPYFNVHLSKIYGTGNGLQPSSKANYSYILGGIALFILFIACINFINLSLSRAMRRSKEIGIRKVIGGSRKQLIVQFLGESFILSLIGSLLAIVIVVISLPEFNNLSGKELQVSYLFNGQTAGIFLLILFANTLLSGFYPAVVLSGFKPVDTLYKKLKFGGHNYFGKSLVVLQFVVAIFLVIGTLVMQKQFSYLVNYDLGYKPQNIVDLQLPQDKNPNYNVFKNSLLKYPYIKQVSGQLASFTSTYGTMYKSGDKSLQGNYFDIDNDFLTVMNIRLISGHGFRYSAGDTTECLVNEAFVKSMGWPNSPLGRIITCNGGKSQLTVVGVVANFHTSSLLNSAVEPSVFDQTAKAQYNNVMIKIDENQKEKAINAIRAEYRKIIPDYPFNYNFLSNELKQQYDATSKWKQIIMISSMMSIIISCLGLFGLATLAIEKSTKEIGIRKVLGASVGQISSVLLINFLKLVFISIIIAAPLAWYAMDQWLQDYPYRISMNVWIIIIAGAGSLLIAIVTIGSQAIRAALANPVNSLRSE